MKGWQEFKNLVNNFAPGIWRYDRFYPSLEKKYQLTINEGLTVTKVVEDIIFKREDQNPTGSVKDRGMAYQISQAFACGHKHLVLSSSGNSAISAAVFCRLANIKLTVFVSPRVEAGKLKKLQNLNIDLRLSERPLRNAALYRRKYGLRNLRQSLSETAVVGYMSLAFELFEQLFRNLKSDKVSIFIPVSSATTFVGVGRAFRVLKKLNLIERLPELHAVQTVYAHPISEVFDRVLPAKPRGDDLGLAKALCAIKTRRKDEAIGLIKESAGFGWVVTDQQIREAEDWLRASGISTSAEGAAALAAIFKAKKTRDLGTTVCILTGKRYEVFKV